MSANDLKKAIQQSGLTISPNVTGQANETVVCSVCTLSNCLVSGACVNGCDSGTGCDTNCWVAQCSTNCDTGACASCFT